MIFKYEGISPNVRGKSQCTGSIMGIFLLCSEESKEASVATASERVERGARGHQRGAWPDGRRSSCINVRTVNCLYLSLMGKNYRVLFFTYKRIILGTALKTDFGRARIEAKRQIRKFLQ